MPIRLEAADAGYQIDWDSLATVLAEERTKVFLLQTRTILLVESSQKPN